MADVKALGAAASPTRTTQETLVGIFWGYDGSNRIGVPPRLYNQIIGTFVDTHEATVPGGRLSTDDLARLYALVNAGMADAAIAAWSAKYDYDLWRPVLGIREHETGFGPANGKVPASKAPGPLADPFWSPLGRPGTNSPGDLLKTPDVPAYPSGHATFGATAFTLIGHFFAKKAGATVQAVMNDPTFAFDLVSDEFDGVAVDPRGDVRPRVVRTITLHEALIENVLSRVYLGVHWRFDGIGAVAPDGLMGPVPADPAGPVALDPAREKKMGGVALGLAVADKIAATTNFR